MPFTLYKIAELLDNPKTHDVGTELLEDFRGFYSEMRQNKILLNWFQMFNEIGIQDIDFEIKNEKVLMKASRFDLFRFISFLKGKLDSSKICQFIKPELSIDFKIIKNFKSIKIEHKGLVLKEKSGELSSDSMQFKKEVNLLLFKAAKIIEDQIFTDIPSSVLVKKMRNFLFTEDGIGYSLIG